MDDELELAVLEIRVRAALYLLENEAELEDARRERLIEFLERVATGDELILLSTENKSRDYNDRDFETDERTWGEYPNDY